MNAVEKNLVKLVAKLAPWLAPFPSAYFVARSGMVHLALPLPVAIVVAAIIETLGLSTVHSALWLADWNASKRKTDPQAPVVVAMALGAVYLAATLGLVVFLEVWPGLATYAPALFPALAVVGGVNLALISQQEHREAAVKTEKAERKAVRRARRQADRQPTSRVTSNLTPKAAGFADPTAKARQAQSSNRHARLDALLTFYLDNPNAGPTEASRVIGVSRQTIYNYLEELQATGRVTRNDGTVEVLGEDKR
ncbi:hypothetical protein ACFLWA_05355 [Chloroflexota bacterium]